MATVSKQVSSPSQPAPAAIEPSLANAWKAFEEAFNRQEVHEVAAFWEADGTLIGPTGNVGIGRPGVEKVYAADVATILHGTRSTFEIQRVRMLGREHAFLDLDHTISGARLPDGSTGKMKLHIVAVARRSGDQWRWLDARPYAFLPAPPAMH
jgi:uncharacterized protein (TIGR02246 family)